MLRCPYPNSVTELSHYEQVRVHAEMRIQECQLEDDECGNYLLSVRIHISYSDFILPSCMKAMQRIKTSDVVSHHSYFIYSDGLQRGIFN